MFLLFFVPVGCFTGGNDMIFTMIYSFFTGERTKVSAKIGRGARARFRSWLHLSKGCFFAF